MVELFKKFLFVCSVFCLCSNVKAEQFKATEYISGEYVKMVGKDTSKYLTIQIIRDSNYNFVYCIEPFTLVDENYSDYITYESDLSGYDRLTHEQKRKISLLAYYGYGYGDRMTEKWYAITQLLIWRTVDPESDFYFTDKSNGNKIDKYSGSISQLLSDVSAHDREPNFIKDYSIGYREELIINDYNYKYNVESNYEYIQNGSNLIVSEILEDGYFKFQRDTSNYLWNVTIYDSKNTQDIIKPGRIINKEYVINVKVNAGDITLDIRNENSTIYSDSDFSNTCYEISKEDDVIDSVCTGIDGLIYKTNRLAYGEYNIKQVSVGKGYEIDDNLYKVNVNGNTEIVLDNKLIRNKIELTKYYCINDKCLLEENALFNVYVDDLLVGSIITNNSGYGSIEVGVGEYTVVQEGGLNNYTFVDMYNEDIIDSSSKHYKELYNYYIEEDIGGFGTIIPDNSNTEEIVLPPKTGSKLEDFFKMLYNVVMVVICVCNLKRFCYNN